MIEIHITQLIAFFLLGCQLTCLVAGVGTEAKNWLIGSLGLMPIVVILCLSSKIFGGN